MQKRYAVLGKLHPALRRVLITKDGKKKTSGGKTLPKKLKTYTNKAVCKKTHKQMLKK